MPARHHMAVATHEAEPSASSPLHPMLKYVLPKQVRPAGSAGAHSTGSHRSSTTGGLQHWNRAAPVQHAAGRSLSRLQGEIHPFPTSLLQGERGKSCSNRRPLLAFLWTGEAPSPDCGLKGKALQLGSALKETSRTAGVCVPGRAAGHRQSMQHCS